MDLPLRSWGPATGRRALLVHGLNGDGATWEPLAEALAGDGWSVSAIDLRGHGAADPGDDLTLEGYASDLPGSDWDLVIGHSLGGAASVLASQTPGFARSLVLLDPVLEIFASDRDAIVDDQLAELALTEETLAAQKPHWSARDVALKVAGVRRSSERTARASFDDNPDWNVVDEAVDLPVRTLILGGDHAVYSMLARATAEAIADENPLVEYRVIAGAGHSPQRDRFAETLDAIRGFTSAGEPLP